MNKSEMSLMEAVVSDEEYVLVTPARNEECYLEKTIEAVLAQSRLPKKWIIVSDGSVDKTDEIVASYACRHSFIQLLRTGASENPKARDFRGKVRAFQVGHAALAQASYTYIGNLDADVTLPPSYFEHLLEKFACDPLLGVGGGIVLERQRGRFVLQLTSENSVCGSVQLFRRECYESFGGYVPMRIGGVDAAAEIMARMHGWKVRVFYDLPVYAQRRVITGGSSILNTRFRQGMSNYLLGYHPLFHFASCLSRLSQKPYLIGSAAAALGFVYAWLNGSERSLSADVVRYLRSEQMHRLALLDRKGVRDSSGFGLVR